MADLPLSPAAQAIMAAATNGNFNVVNDPVYKQCIAAALRSAARFNPGPCVPELFGEGWDAAMEALADIAAELEGITP